MTLLFWNTKGGAIADALYILSRETKADIIILAECKVTVSQLLRAMNPSTGGEWVFLPSTGVAKTVWLLRGSPTFVTFLREYPRLLIAKISFPTVPPFNLVALHLASSLWYSDHSQAVEAGDAADVIREVESAAGHSRTVVIGDFNMNPFADGLTSAESFNAVSTRQVALQESRKKAGKEYSYFFNPMWGLFNDGTEAAPGTYFFKPPGYESLHWHMIDQVLLRPRMLNFLGKDAVKIVHQCDGLDLCNTNGRPLLSDHFPITVTLSFNV